MLSEEELVASIKSKMPDFPIHVSDLKTPTVKFVKRYYIRILEEFGVDVDALKEPPPEQLQELDYLDAYRYILPLAYLHGVLCCIFEHIYVDDFSILDLTEPSNAFGTLLLSFGHITRIGMHKSLGNKLHSDLVFESLQYTPTCIV
jgi:hypothetical protein